MAILTLGVIQGGQGTLTNFNFSGLTVGASATPNGLTVTRASVAGAENGDNSYKINVAAINQGRIAKFGTNTGLRAERATTNLFIGPRTSASWSPAFAGSSTTGTSGTDMSGATFATLQLHNVLLAGYGKFPTMTGLTVGQFYSESMAAMQGSTTALQIHGYTGSDHIINGVLTSAWVRFSKFFTQGALTTNSVIPCDGRDLSGSGGEVAQSRNYYTDLHQLEVGPTSTWCSASRAGERFQYLGSSLVSGTRLKFEVTWIPDVSAADASTCSVILGNLRLWTLDVNNYAEIVIGGADHRKIKIVIAGSAEILSTALPNWARFDRLVIRVDAGNGVNQAWYTLNPTTLGDPAVTTLGTGSSQTDLIVAASNLDLFCSSTTNQLQGIIQLLKCYA